MRSETLKNIVMFVPLVTLAIVLAFNIFNLMLEDENYDNIIYHSSRVLSEVFGYSLMSVLVYSYMAWRHKFCLYSKVAIMGLVFQNILNIVDYIFGLDYNIYVSIVSISGASIFILFSLIQSKK